MDKFNELLAQYIEKRFQETFPDNTSVPFVSKLTRRDSFKGDHKNLINNTVPLPEDHASYQKQAMDRIKGKVKSWEEGGELSEEELNKVNGMLVEGKLKTGVLDTEELVDAVRDYLQLKKEHGDYSEKEETANNAASEFTEVLVGNDLYEMKAKDVLQKLKTLKDSLDEIEAPEALRWAGIKTKVEELYNKIDGQEQEHVLVEDALEMQSLMASWPPSINDRLLEHKSRVNTKILARPKEMDLFDMPLDDLQLRENSKNELEQLNTAMTDVHTIRNEKVILKLEDVNKTVREFREFNKQLDSPDKKAAHLQYGKDLDKFVLVLNSLKDENKKGSTGKLKRQISATNFQDAAKALQTALTDQDPKLDGIDGLLQAVTNIIGDFSSSGKTKQVEAAYKALIKAITKAPTTLSPNVLALKQAQEQAKHGKDSTWFRDDLFETAKGLANGAALVFEELNEYHKYINELNNFVLSLITVDGEETEEAAKSRKNIIEQLSIEAIEGSVSEITNWQSRGDTQTAIEEIENAMGALSGSNIPGKLATVMDSLAGFKTAFDPIAGRNFTKKTTTINNTDVVSATRDESYDNPLNPSNGKEAAKGIAIMKGTVDTLMAVKKVVQEFTKPPSTDTLKKTIELCKKWNNAILNLSFEKDVKILTKNIDILAKFPKTSTPPSKKELKGKTIEDLKKVGGFSISNFQDTLKRRLIESIEKHFGEKIKESGRTYGLKFSELSAYVDKDFIVPETIDGDYKTRALEVQYVDGMIGKIEEKSYLAILKPFEERYHGRIDDEIKWREERSGKDGNIQEKDGFKKITTFKHIKEQSNSKITFYIDQVSDLGKKMEESTKSMELKIYLKNVNTNEFAEFANAGSKEDIQSRKRRYPNTYQNLIEKSDTAALPTTLKSMKATAKIADGIDMMSSSFVQASRILTSIVPDNDMTEEKHQVQLKKWQAVNNLIGTTLSSAASITAAFVGPYAPIPLLVGGIIKGITGAINIVIDRQIKGSEAKQCLDKFIAIFDQATKALQAARNKVSDQRERLQGWLQSILEAIKNINEKMAVVENN